MRVLWRLTRLLWQADPWAMWRGAAAALAVLVMGAALLGLSGWFITATGLAGIGIAFDVFRPSAGVRFLALGRAGARYAERLLTHDATLRALARLRLTLMARLETWPITRLRRLRGASELTRITADVDALDGLLLRLVLPLAAGLLTHALALAALWMLVSGPVALTVAGGYVLGGAVVLALVARGALRPSARAEEVRQAIRRRVIGLFRGQRDAILQATLPIQRNAIAADEDTLRATVARLDRIDRRAGLALNALVVLVTGAVLGIGTAAVQSAAFDPALAAIGVFVALALAETLLPLRRGLADLGRMHAAALRVIGPDQPAQPPAQPPDTHPDAQAGLTLHGVTVALPGRHTPLFRALDLHARPGETIALRGPSGSGKSTLLDALAGVAPRMAGQIDVLGVPLGLWPEDQLRAHLTLVPQRPVLIGGTIRENLALACDDLDDASAQAALRTARLEHVIAQIGGLDARLGESGAGLSGGESRRLALARAVLRAPGVLLLDEPTEGLDDALAREVLGGLRAALPRAVIVMAAHRDAEIAAADRVISLN
ncbi:ATP-binding cassette domain-containing protein [Sediminimonas sp.]|uniref:amino acid ABC transporter ATP-binding/permease protein n=1 Tax=Sediminimonas sp. TaxID=2823379 RepID=UPI0025E761F1|nr:ATP-binding cassette domain-containing protein [Sediminimonas sp.]